MLFAQRPILTYTQHTTTGLALNHHTTEYSSRTAIGLFSIRGKLGPGEIRGEFQSGVPAFVAFLGDKDRSNDDLNSESLGVGAVV